MLSYTLQIKVKPGYERNAVRTLSTIERNAQLDSGCLYFAWFQDAQDPYGFTLVEQWDTRDHLDAHLSRDPSVWEEFVPALAGAPVSRELRPVGQLAQPPRAEEIDEFVCQWFRLLSDRAPVEELLSLVARDGLDMRFPDATLTNDAEFRDWYQAVGTSVRDQAHDLLTLESVPVAGEPAADIALQVIWSATPVSGGRRFSARASQAWRVQRSFTTGRLQILRYKVESLVELEPAADGIGGAA